MMTIKRMRILLLMSTLMTTMNVTVEPLYNLDASRRFECSTARPLLICRRLIRTFCGGWYIDKTIETDFVIKFCKMIGQTTSSPSWFKLMWCPETEKKSYEGRYRFWRNHNSFEIYISWKLYWITIVIYWETNKRVIISIHAIDQTFYTECVMILYNVCI